MSRTGGVFNADFETQVLERALRYQGGTALPDAVAAALNETAASITRRSQDNVRRRLTVRAQYTLNSIKQDRHARGRVVERMFARTGTRSPYLPIQNRGGVIRARNRSVPIPTVAARTARSLNRRIAGRYAMNKMGNIGSDGRFFMGSPRGGGRPAGIWERHSGNRRLRLLRRLGNSQVTVPASRWFDDAIAAHAHLAPARFRREANRRLARTPGASTRR